MIRLKKHELYAMLREAVENTVRMGAGEEPEVTTLAFSDNPWWIIDKSGQVLNQLPTRDGARRKLKEIKSNNPNVRLIKKAA